MDREGLRPCGAAAGVMVTRRRPEGLVVDGRRELLSTGGRGTRADASEPLRGDVDVDARAGTGTDADEATDGGEPVIASPLQEAKPGDIWLFSRTGFYNKLIAFKTWSRFTHVEAVILRDRRVETFTSRNGQGVNVYAPDLNGLALVLRPSCHLDQAAALMFAKTVAGQRYDYVGLLAFYFAKYQGRENGKMFCSEAVIRFMRAGGCDLFPETDADTVAPRDFSLNPSLNVVWRSSDEWHRWQAQQAEGR